jgi:FKBP-type peptidyl-prolyl cis-trans isomerase
MKNTLLIIFAVFAVTVFFNCKGNSGSFHSEVNFNKDASYALGLNIGSGLRDGLLTDSVYPDYNEFMKGMRDGMLGKKPRFELDEAREIIESSFNVLTEEKNAVFFQNEIDFLAENAKKPGVIRTQSGLQYEIILEGNGPKPSADSVVKIHYESRLTDGFLFDNTYEHQEPAIIALDDVYTGWPEGLLEGIQLMSVGSKYKLYIPSNIGLGPTGYGPIPAYSTLIYSIELIEITTREEYEAQFNYYN